MNGQTLILFGAAIGLFGWRGVPRWRKVLRLVPVIALALLALDGFVSIQLPPFVSPMLIGMGAAVAILQVMK